LAVLRLSAAQSRSARIQRVGQLPEDTSGRLSHDGPRFHEFIRIPAEVRPAVNEGGSHKNEWDQSDIFHECLVGPIVLSDCDHFLPIVFTGAAGLPGNFTGFFSFDMTSVIPRSSCGSFPTISDAGSLSTSMSGSTP